MSAKPAVLFICVKNSGKSQMAAALLRHEVGDRVEIHSAGTRPGRSLNRQSMEALQEIGVSTGAEYPKPVDQELLARVDLLVLVGTEASLQAPDGVEARTWATDEPSERGIEGMDRMRLIRDDIHARARALAQELTPT